MWDVRENPGTDHPLKLVHGRVTFFLASAHAAFCLVGAWASSSRVFLRPYQSQFALSSRCQAERAQPPTGPAQPRPAKKAADCRGRTTSTVLSWISAYNCSIALVLLPVLGEQELLCVSWTRHSALLVSLPKRALVMQQDAADTLTRTSE